MNVRRSAAALAAATVVLGAAVPAVAATPSPAPSVAIPDGLYGTADPTYDGVWRQSLALLAQHTAGVTPAAKAVAWLAGQQCANGAFAAFRADTAKPCDAKLMVDTNSTAAAVQALAALGGHGAAAQKAVGWLKSVQNADGGWGYTPGGASDANSTSVVAGALAAAGQRPADVRKAGKSAYDALAKLSIPCDKAGGGAFAYQPDKRGGLAANADATAAGVLGALGKGFVTTAGKAQQGGPVCGDSPAPPTPSDLARNGSHHLAETLRATGFLKSALPGAEDQPDYGNTADAVVALAAQGWTEQARKPLAWLEQNSAAWAKQSGPAAYAQLVFAAHAMGADPRHFGGADLVAQLGATGPAPQSAGKAAGQTGDRAAESAGEEVADSGHGVWWIVGVFLVAGVGIGLLISVRGRKQRQP